MSGIRDLLVFFALWAALGAVPLALAICDLVLAYRRPRDPGAPVPRLRIAAGVSRLLALLALLVLLVAVLLPKRWCWGFSLAASLIMMAAALACASVVR